MSFFVLVVTDLFFFCPYIYIVLCSGAGGFKGGRNVALAFNYYRTGIMRDAEQDLRMITAYGLIEDADY